MCSNPKWWCHKNIHMDPPPGSSNILFLILSFFTSVTWMSTTGVRSRVSHQPYTCFTNTPINHCYVTIPCYITRLLLVGYCWQIPKFDKKNNETFTLVGSFIFTWLSISTILSKTWLNDLVWVFSPSSSMWSSPRHLNAWTLTMVEIEGLIMPGQVYRTPRVYPLTSREIEPPTYPSKLAN